MKIISFPLSGDEAIERIKSYLGKKEFEIFADINHQSNAKSANFDMPYSRVLIFGNPLAGTKLMQKDIFMSYDMPLRVAIVEKENEMFLIHQTSADYINQYQVEGHPVLEKVENLFSALASELTS